MQINTTYLLTYLELFRPYRLLVVRCVLCQIVLYRNRQQHSGSSIVGANVQWQESWLIVPLVTR